MDSKDFSQLLQNHVKETMGIDIPMEIVASIYEYQYDEAIWECRYCYEVGVNWYRRRSYCDIHWILFNGYLQSSDDEDGDVMMD